MPVHDRETLYGWKQIADHLQVTVRAAQLWEQRRGLPVRRYPRGKRPRVYALPDELDSWMLGPGSRDSSDSRRVYGDRNRKTPHVISLVAMVTVVFALALWSPWTGGRKDSTAARCEISDQTLSVFDQQGKRIWDRFIPNLSRTYASGEPRYPGCTVMDVDGDGSVEILVQFVGQDRFSGGKLICFKPGVEIPLWEHSYGRSLSWGAKNYSGSYIGKLVRQVSAHGRPYLVSVARHTPSFPAVLSLLDPVTGKVVDDYSHPGHIFSAEFADFDGDQEPEVMLGGVINPGVGPGYPVLTTLDIPFSGEHLERRIASDFFGNSGPRELAYWVFPVSDADMVTGLSSQIQEIGIPTAGLIEVVVSGPNGTLNYRIRASDLRAPVVESVIPQPDFRQAHDRLVRDGRLPDFLSGGMPSKYYRIRFYETVPDVAAVDVSLGRAWGAKGDNLHSAR